MISKQNQKCQNEVECCPQKSDSLTDSQKLIAFIEELQEEKHVIQEPYKVDNHSQLNDS